MSDTNNFKREIQELIAENSSKLHIAPEAYKRIVLSSITQSVKDIESLREVIAHQNYLEIKDIAHRLKGVYLNLRITDLSDIAHQIDMAAQNQTDINEIQNLLTAFEKAFLQLKNEF